MIRNYFKVAIRTLFRNKVFSMINILGLSVGLASVIMIILFVKHEVSYDKFFEDSDRIYRIISVYKEKDNAHAFPMTMYDVAPRINKEVPEVIASTRMFRYRNTVVKYDENDYGDYWLMYADSSFLDVFSYRLIQGDRASCLSSPNTVVITESMAKEIFGEQNPINKSMEIEEKSFQVTGVLQDVPANSHLDFDFLMSITTMSELRLRQDGNSHITYFKLDRPLNEEVETKILSTVSGYVNKMFEQFELEYEHKLQPLTAIHLHSDYTNDLAVTGNIQYIYIFSLIAVFILVIAGVNFVNLSIAKADTRKKEVGVRKVNGASRKSLRLQFIGESVIIALASFLISMLLVETFLDDFSNLVSSRLDLSYRSEFLWILGFVLLSILVGILSGIYPAYYISKFNSVKILKGDLSGGKKRAPLQVVLVVLQFTIAVALIAALFGIGKQVSYMKNKDLGFDKDQLLIAYGLTGKIVSKYEAIKDKILEDPGIERVTASNTFPGSGTSGMSLKLREQSPKESFPVRETRVQDDFAETYGIEIVRGRDFMRDMASDKEGFLINETAAKMLGVENVIGKEVDVWTHPGKVVGVFKDFHIKSLHHQIEPFVLSRYARQIGAISVRFAVGNAERAKEHLFNVLTEYDPDYTYQYLFLDNYWERKYSKEDKSAKLIIAGSILTIIISIMGLFALTAFNIHQRTKEIGIRKSLGASVKVIVKMLLKQYLKWVVIASVIAIPFAWMFLTNWFENFAYHISVEWWFFILAIFVALLISSLAILFKVLKAANENPVDSLRYE